jgi:hypothetical protein
MTPVLEVDVDALNADGGRLESPGHPFKPSNCAPPGADAVSIGAARALNAHEMALIEVLDYATRVREYGGRGHQIRRSGVRARRPGWCDVGLVNR